MSENIFKSTSGKPSGGPPANGDGPDRKLAGPGARVHVVTDGDCADRWLSAFDKVGAGLVNVTTGSPDQAIPADAVLVCLDAMPSPPPSSPNLNASHDTAPATGSDANIPTWSETAIVGVGALPFAAPGTVGPGMLKIPPERLRSLVPVLCTDWFVVAWNLLSSDAVGVISRIHARIGTGMMDDPDCDAARAIAFICAVGGPIDWQTINGPGGDEGGRSTFVRGGQGAGSTIVEIELLESSGPLRVVFAGPSGTLRASIGPADARLIMSGPVETADDLSAGKKLNRPSDKDPDGAILFDGRFDPFASAARFAARAALKGPASLLPATVTFAFRDSYSSMVSLLKGHRGNSDPGAANNDPRTGPRLSPDESPVGGFVANSFVSASGIPGDGTSSDSGALRELKVFVADTCNLNCPFCFSRTPTSAATSVSQYGEQFRAARLAGYGAVILSGGEPTLNRDLAAIVATATESGMNCVGIETNAILIGRNANPTDYVASLVNAGLRRALVSFHSLDDATLARMTGVQGTLPAATAGVRALLDGGVAVEINCVTTELNYRELPEIARNFATAAPPRIEQMVLSFMAGLGAAATRPDLYPRMSAVVPYFDEAIGILLAAGIDVAIPGQCGLPQCILPHRADVFCNQQVARRMPEWVAPRLEGKVFAPSCGRCTARRWCHGIWKVYSDVFGFDEFVPI